MPASTCPDANDDVRLIAREVALELLWRFVAPLLSPDPETSTSETDVVDDYLQSHRFTKRDVERFWSKVHIGNDDGCWLWEGLINTGGYGQFDAGGKSILAHRAAYALENGVIPSGKHVLHACDVRHCCRPDHLRLGSNADNAADRAKRHRAASGERHPFSRLTENEVRAIRSSKESNNLLAAQFGVKAATISSVRRRRSWKHSD
jgi:hypothetical protein